MLPPGATVRATAAPLLAAPACSLGRTPLADVALPPGEYLALLRLAGHDDLRLPLQLWRGQHRPSVALDRVGAVPEGCVRIWPLAIDGMRRWIMEREVMASEYLEFLNDPATLQEVASSPEPIRVPRAGNRGASRPIWERGEDGRFALPRDWRPTLPIVGVSWHDAQAFAAWRNQQASASGSSFEYALPTLDEFTNAGGGGLRRSFTWGNRFRAGYARTCFGRKQAGLGPVLQFPIDESPYGAFGFCGDATEWLDAWYDELRNLRHLGGGAWGEPNPDVLGIGGGMGLTPDASGGQTGFRLVLRPRQALR
jgi:hypothetical protein